MRLSDVTRNEWVIPAILLVCAFMVRWFFFYHDANYLVTFLLPDDAYYYVVLAKHAAQGMGSTFDGMHATNGYHPLWMWVATGVYGVFATSDQRAVQVLLCIASLCEVITGALLWVLLRSAGVRFWIRCVSLVLYLGNPWAIAQGLNGMESALANALLMGSLALSSVCLTPGRSRYGWYLAFLSVCSAFTILARIDYAFHILLLGIVVWYAMRSSWRPTWYAAAFLPGGFILGLWAYVWWRSFGAIIPQSAFAFALVNKTLFFYKARSTVSVMLWSGYQWVQSLGVAARTSGFWWILWPLILMPFGMIGLQRKSASRDSLPIGRRLYYSLAISMLVYTFVQGALRWSGREWYFSLAPLLGAWALALGGEWAVRDGKKWMRYAWAVVVLIVLGCMGYTNPLVHPRFLHQREIVEAAHALEAYVPMDARIGMFNAGILGYTAHRTIVNLDGVVNTSAYVALRDHQLRQYLADEHIAYVLDYDIAVRYRYAPFWGVTGTDFLKPIAQFSQHSSYHDSALTLYRVESLP